MTCNQSFFNRDKIRKLEKKLDHVCRVVSCFLDYKPLITAVDPSEKEELEKVFRELQSLWEDEYRVAPNPYLEHDETQENFGPK